MTMFIRSIFIATLIFTKSSAQNHLKFSLINQSIKDSTNLEILVTNSSPNNYYLLLDPSNFYSEDSTNAWMYIAYKNPINIYVSDRNDDMLISEIVDENFEIHHGAVKTFDSKSILKVSAREKVKFQIPFKFQYVLDDKTRLVTEPKQMDENKKYFIQVHYNPPNEAFKEVLQLSDELKDYFIRENYKLYEKDIKSNFVPLIKP